MVKHRAPRDKNYLLILGCTLALASILVLLVLHHFTSSAPVKAATPTIPRALSIPDPRQTTAELAQEKDYARAAAKAELLAKVMQQKQAQERLLAAEAEAEARRKAKEKSAAEAAAQKAAAAAKAKAAVVIPVPAPVPAPAPVSGGVAAYQAYAAGKVSASEYSCLVPMWNRESGWNPNAQNPTSTAYGIAQFLDSTWAGTGYAKTSNPYTQIDAGVVYVNKAYGGACNAWAFWQAHSYY